MPDPIPRTDPLRTRAPRGRPWMWIVAALLVLLLILWVAFAGTGGNITGAEAVNAPAATTEPLADDAAPVAAD
ncbi:MULTISPECIES: hypothetical protein [Marinovum]|uniref:hypothetical protein n=1 Tax=Marinovum TaxID=367771 RepID=UPI00065B3110|nr:hypothetical protein [Marinovum sp. PR37]AKO96490.1 hypothetical protein MALG_01305 [Marinovum algicola DG 898]MDD9745842.1 hypothetical protein [Marinovum sp. PR37]